MISKYVRWLWKAEGVVQKFPPDIGPNPIRIQDTLPIGRPDFSSSGPQDLSLKRIKTAFFCLCLSSTTVEMWVSQSRKKTAVPETLLVLESSGIKRKWSRVGRENKPLAFSGDSRVTSSLGRRFCLLSHPAKARASHTQMEANVGFRDESSAWHREVGIFQLSEKAFTEYH